MWRVNNFPGRTHVKPLDLIHLVRRKPQIARLSSKLHIYCVTFNAQSCSFAAHCVVTFSRNCDGRLIRCMLIGTQRLTKKSPKEDTSKQMQEVGGMPVDDQTAAAAAAASSTSPHTPGGGSTFNPNQQFSPAELEVRHIFVSNAMLIFKFQVFFFFNANLIPFLSHVHCHCELQPFSGTRVGCNHL